MVEAEKIVFHFEGSLADSHSLNFYEAARFQYAAARFVVKLLQFRASGSFVKKITNNTNSDILLETHSRGSFDISILIPIAMAAKDAFISTSASQLMSYVFERLVGKTPNNQIASVLNAQSEVVRQFGKINDNDTSTIMKALELIQHDQIVKDQMYRDNKETLQRLNAELVREREINEKKISIFKNRCRSRTKIISNGFASSQ